MNYKVFQKLERLGKDFFSIADLQKIFLQKRKSLYVTLNRLVKSGWLLRVRSGIYQLAAAPGNIEKIANQIYYPSYLSFESALSRYGVLSQIPYALTFATTKRTKRLVIRETGVLYRQLKKELFFGYKFSSGIYLAEKEKALLDQLYLISGGKSKFRLKDLDLKEISKSKFWTYSKRFPGATQKLAQKMWGEA